MSTTEFGSLVDLTACDLSNQTGTIFDVENAGLTSVSTRNCVLNSSHTKIGGTASGEYRIEFWNTTNDTGTGWGTDETIQDFGIYTNHGDTILETTAVRTGGASDGKTGSHSWAMTPTIDSTRDYYLGMESPEGTIWVDGDGTSKTLTVYFAKSNASDYDDDEIALEVHWPSEANASKYECGSTRGNLLATPSTVTDDTGSTWGTGANNPQKLELTIAPDYSGYVYWKVVVYKHFSSSPHTIYVDPKPEIS